ncbi:MAG TPA: ribosomal protein S18-alanine N-acetyltransferase [Candidatus Dormibacteraeota bacterium]|jgi:ribosomal-protein-alanine N-acetyltransferase|nr:ribosomal protein S18-alanine N-acetyltransferase [Candidatus Dormibacteraeota bacterium]
MIGSERNTGVDAVMQLRQRARIEPMTLEDIPAIQAIEREIFLTPWPRNAYRRELSQNRMAAYIVVRAEDEVVGYAGIWKMRDEAHVTTVGVRKRDQGKGYGKALMVALIDEAYAADAKWVTLEVRASNHGAIGLYERLGFKIIGRRRGYYTDDGEDAIVMWSDSLLAPAFVERLRQFRESLTVEVRLGADPRD